MNEAVAMIKNGTATCVILRDGEIIRSVNVRGIKPILSAYEDGILKGATVIDKVTGRAAAMVMALGGVAMSISFVASEGALAVLREHGVYTFFEKEVEYIVNRAGDGMCPMEKAVQGIDDLTAALDRIKNTLSELGK